MQGDVMPAGRPTEYNPNIHPAIAESLARKGLTNTEIADGIGVCPATLYTWQNEHPEFLEAIKRGKASADDEVEKSLYKRACGYDVIEEKPLNIGGELLIARVNVHIHPDPTSCIFWLKNRRPKEWRDKQEIQHSGNIQIIIDKDDAEL
jgi:hypothetical protein